MSNFLLEFKKLDKRAKIPKKQTDRSSGFDVSIIEGVTIKPGQTVILGTGLAMASFFELVGPSNIILDAEFQLRLRSSIAVRGLTMPNAPATIDADYKGEIKILLTNISNFDVTLEAGERVAQAVMALRVPVEVTTDDETDKILKVLNPVERKGGLGSTGKF